MSRRLLLVTGMSGAGRSSCLKVLEDIGFEAVDNLPVTMIERLVRQDLVLEGDLAIGCDSRTRAFSPPRLIALLDRLKTATGHEMSLLFFDCDDEVLLRRFTETRRRHPMAADRPVIDGIQRERALLAPLRERADLLIDTSQLHTHDLRRVLRGHFAQPGARRLAITVMSFSFRRGLPREADIVFDVRFLRNPHYVPELAPLTGEDEAVQRHIEADPAFAPFFENLSGLLRPLLPRYLDEGKSYLTIAIGCTGGQHRSVHTARLLAAELAKDDWEIMTIHRDMPVSPAGSGKP